MAAPNPFTTRIQECADRLLEDGVDALAGLFDLASQRLVRFSVTITRNQHDAEDAVQAALVRVATEPQRLAKAESPWAYLLQMVRNEALQIARKKQRWKTEVSLIDLVTLRRVDELEMEETHRAVWTALRTLPPEQAEVVVLKIWEEMTFAQIGQVLETSPNTIASRYQYAMSKLSQILQKQHREMHHDRPL
jgi:RNA polymerase sigma-70 factor (ECF subfamily)